MKTKQKRYHEKITAFNILAQFECLVCKNFFHITHRLRYANCIWITVRVAIID